MTDQSTSLRALKIERDHYLELYLVERARRLKQRAYFTKLLARIRILAEADAEAES